MSAADWVLPTWLILLHLDLSCVLQRKAVPLLSLAELSLELVLLVCLPVLLWWLSAAVSAPEEHHRQNLRCVIISLRFEFGRADRAILANVAYRR